MIRTAEREIGATPDKIFAILTDIDKHAEFDGSGQLVGRAEGPRPLVLGSRFTMGMQRGRLGYRSINNVMEYQPNRLIAWETIAEFRGRRIMGGHRWRYELEPRGERTLVRESYDWSTALKPWLTIELPKQPDTYELAMGRTLQRLAELAERSQPS